MNNSDLLTLARKVNNYEIDPVGGLKVLWIDTTHFTGTVPLYKRWIVLGGIINRNVNSTVIVALRDVSNNTITHLLDEPAATGLKVYPESDFQIGRDWILDPGEDFYMLFGVAQDAGSYANCVVLEVNI